MSDIETRLLLITTILRLWEHYPGQRLGQLLTNYGLEPFPTAKGRVNELWSISDQTMLDHLLKWLSAAGP